MEVHIYDTACVANVQCYIGSDNPVEPGQKNGNKNKIENRASLQYGICDPPGVYGFQ